PPRLHSVPTRRSSDLGALGDGITFVPTPTDDHLAVAVGAIVRTDVVVDAAFLDRTPHMRVLARTGVGTDLVDLDAATARGIAVRSEEHTSELQSPDHL